MRPHISLDVHDFEASVRIYQKVFGLKPKKETAGYAKFDVSTPPLNLSLGGTTGEVSSANHFGIEVQKAPKRRLRKCS